MNGSEGGTLRSKLVRINSSSRKKAAVYNYTSSDFRLDFNLNIPDLIKVHSIVLKSCSIPNTEYNINDTNYTFSFIAGLDETTIVIPFGNYTIDTLIAAIMDSPQAEFYEMTIQVAQPSGKLQFTTNTNIQLLNAEQGNAMAQVLGILTNSPPTSNYIVDGLPNLLGLQNIYIVSQALSGGVAMIDSSLNQISVFSQIPMNVPWGNVNHYTSPEEQSDEIFFPSDRTIGEIDLTLYNDMGRIIDLHGLDWSMIIKIYYHVASIY